MDPKTPVTDDDDEDRDTIPAPPPSRNLLEEMVSEDTWFRAPSLPEFDESV